MKALAAMVMVLAGGAAYAQTFDAPLCDPCIPPALKATAKVRVEPGSRDAALRAEVEAKLRAPFEKAATAGLLTREQASAAGLGLIARHVAQIDRDSRGAIRFEDYKRFLKERGAALD